MMDKIEVYESKSDNPSEKWRWRLRASNGRIIAESGEGYSDKYYTAGMATGLFDAIGEAPAVEFVKADEGDDV